MLFQDTVFWILAVIAIGGALGVVLVKDLFRAALLLVVVFMAVAGFFVLMSAEFLAVVQVLIYVGAISILIIFAVMLTRDVQQGNLPNQLQIPAVLFAAVLLAVLVVVATDTNWDLTADALAERAQTLSGQARLEEGAGRDLISETAQAAIDGGELDQAEVAGLLATELQDRVDLVQTHSGSIVTDEALGAVRLRHTGVENIRQGGGRGPGLLGRSAHRRFRAPLRSGVPVATGRTYRLFGFGKAEVTGHVAGSHAYH